jgi:hypothetical protein
MILAIELNERVIAIARNEDIVECVDDSMATALRAEGYFPFGECATSRPATDAEQARYREWLKAGRVT